MKNLVVISLLVALFATLGMSNDIVEKNLFQEHKGLGGEIEIFSSRLHSEGEDNYLTFEIEAPATGEYYASSWMLGGQDATGKFTSYDLLINNLPVSLKAQATKSTWHNGVFTHEGGKPGTIRLNKGRNTISFIGKSPEVPQIEYIRLASAKEKAMISETPYNDFLFRITERKETEELPELRDVCYDSKYPRNPQNYSYGFSYKLNMEYQYTTLIVTDLKVGANTISTSCPGAKVPHVVSVYYSGGGSDNATTQQHAWGMKSNSSYTTNLSFTATKGLPGRYYVKVRADQPGQTGEVTLVINGKTYTNMPVTCSKLDMTTEGTAGKNNITFLCEGTEQPHLVVEDRTNPNIIYGYNNTYNFTKIANGTGHHCALFEPAGGWNKTVYVSKWYTTGATVAKGDLYANCQSYNGSKGYQNWKSLPYVSGILATPPDDSYNCFSWVGGVVDTWWNPDTYWVGDPYIKDATNALNALDRYLGNSPVPRYSGAPSYCRGAGAVIDIWGIMMPAPSSPGLLHAAIKRGADQRPHGFDWESKMGAGERFFHYRDGIIDNNNREIIYSYGKCSGLKAAATEETGTDDLTLYESLEQNLSVLEYQQFTDADQEILQSLLSEIPYSDMLEFEKRYGAWKNTWERFIHSSSVNVYRESEEYEEFISFCKEKGKQIWPLLFVKYPEKPFVNHVPLIDLTLIGKERSQAISDSILQYNLQNLYNDEGSYIVRDMQSNEMRYIRQLLHDAYQESGGSLKNTMRTEKVAYSNSYPFSILYKQGQHNVEIGFSFEQDAMIGLSVCDISGSEIVQLINKKRYAAGEHIYDFDTSGLSSGTYFVKYVVNGILNVKKVLIP
ncbi:MAG: T9SS type A sorting domain-containing protein [Candidatus Azobacteroides sp.]|nr:T9SS type A sorting domain-containing protein [Candidatus Azobacteroides sp.]